MTEEKKYEIILIFNGDTKVFANIEKVLNFIKKEWNKLHYLSIRKVWSGSRILKQLKGELPKIKNGDED